MAAAAAAADASSLQKKRSLQKYRVRRPQNSRMLLLLLGCCRLPPHLGPPLGTSASASVARPRQIFASLHPPPSFWRAGVGMRSAKIYFCNSRETKARKNRFDVASASAASRKTGAEGVVLLHRHFFLLLPMAQLITPAYVVPNTSQVLMPDSDESSRRWPVFWLD